MDRDNRYIQLACFNLGETLFAVDIMRIREIILPQKLSALPGTSQLLEGVINLRGAVIPVMDMRKRFGISAAPDYRTGKLLIVSLARQKLALAVDNVMEVITVPAVDIKPPRDIIAGFGLEHLLGVCLSDDRVFMILDIDSLLGNSGHPVSMNSQAEQG
ncbi:MAG: chemotaxis protein CheW [Desulfuromonadales bacterium]|nr:chemotaxis protein CheW [Desulfuromonadales bacterium]